MAYRLPLNRARWAAGLVAVILLGFANRLWELDQIASDGTWYPSLWPWWFLAAAVATVLWVVCPWRRWMLAVSGALVVSAFVSRAVAVGLAIADGTTGLLTVQLHIAGIAYTGLALAAGWLWVHDLRPLSAVTRGARQGNG